VESARGYYRVTLTPSNDESLREGRAVKGGSSIILWGTGGRGEEAKGLLKLSREKVVTKKKKTSGGRTRGGSYGEGHVRRVKNLKNSHTGAVSHID